jgi:long-subunit fatty acid transport protein
MGNSYTAISNDFSAVLFNPAGLGLVKRFGLSATLNTNTFNNDVSFFGENTGASKNTVNLNQFGFIFPVPTVRGSLVFSLGYNRVKDFHSITEFDGFNGGNTSMVQHLTGDINDVIPLTNDIRLAYEILDPNTESYVRDTTLINGLLNQSGRIRTQGGVGKWSFALSNEVAKGLFIGGTFNILNGSYKRDRDYFEDDTRDIYASNTELVPGDPLTKDFRTFYLNDIIDWDLSGWDFKLGILYNYIDFIKFGATVKFPSYYKIKENYYVNVSSEFGTNTSFELFEPIIDKVDYKIKTPFEFSAGVSIKTLVFTISGEAKLIDYTQMKFTEGLGTEYRIEKNKEIDDLFRTAATYNAGLEVKFPSFPVRGRIGMMYIQSPYDGDPTDFDKQYLTAGLGLMLGQVFSIDVAYAYGWWSNFSDNYGSNVSRTQQDVYVHNVVLSFSTGLN